MLNLFNNNLSLFDHNLLSYGFILVSLSILGYSIYYFSGDVFKTTVDTTTLPNSETFNQRLVENLNNYQTLNLDNKVPTMSNFVESLTEGPNNEGIQLVGSAVQTEGNQLVDSSVQTDLQMLYDYMNELLYNNAIPTTSLGEIEIIQFFLSYIFQLS